MIVMISVGILSVISIFHFSFRHLLNLYLNLEKHWIV